MSLIVDRRGQVWEDPRGMLHLIVRAPRLHVTLTDQAVFHGTLRLLSGELSNLTDVRERMLENRPGWRRIA